MNQKLYYRAYKFLKLRAIDKNPFEAVDDLNVIDRNKVLDFLRYNHQVKFI